MGSNDHVEGGSFAIDNTSRDVEQENRLLRETISQLKHELDRYRSPALLVAELVEIVDDNHAMIVMPNGNKFFVDMAQSFDNLRPGDSVLVEQKNLTVVDKVETNRKFNVEQFVIVEKPNTKWKDVGGLDKQAREVQEVVELPLKSPELFNDVGIEPPKGILLHGPPGTGKTMLAKAVAKESEANFIAVKGPELLSKWVNETPQLVKKLFEKARQVAPSVIFIDEIDAITANRSASGQGESDSGMNAVNQLLTELDGLQELNDVVVIAATNIVNSIDQALRRPGRFDRIILAGVPDKEAREAVFNVHLKNMKLADDVDVNELVEKTDGYVGADIEAICREAVMIEMRRDVNTKKISKESFDQALLKVKPSASKEIQEAYEELKDKFSAAKGKEMKSQKPSYYG